MKFSDMPLITPEIRTTINDISEHRYLDIEKEVNKMLTYPHGKFVEDFIYHNVYQMGKNNMIYGSDDRPMMTIFDFDKRSKIKIMNVLGIKQHNPNMHIIKVFPDTIVPLHLDLNKGNNGRESAILSIVISGDQDSMLYIGNKLDGEYQFALPGYSEFIMYPTQIVHGAKSGKLPYTLLQITIDTMTLTVE